MTQISRFIEAVVPIAQNVTGDGDESAAPKGGGGFADYALVSLHCLRIYLDTSYRMTIDLLKEMPQITGEIGLSAADLPSPSTLCKAFDRISMSVCRVLLRQSAQLHDPSEHAAIDATFYERDRASRHYCHRTNYRVQTLKARGADSDDTISPWRSVTVRLGSTYQIATSSLSNALHKILLRLSADLHDNERRLKKLTRQCS